MKKVIRILKFFMITIASIVLLFSIAVVLYIRQDKFGQAPGDDRRKAFERSPNFRDGKFQNFTATPDLTEGYSMTGVMYRQFFDKAPRRRPTDIIPSVKTNILALPADSNVLVWFGHSSYYMQIDGIRMLVDPVFSGNASPVPGTNKSFNGTDVYTVSDLPDIDYLFISHDHYDHVDYETLTELKPKTKKIICGLGIGSHLAAWGYDSAQIIETDWYEKLTFDGVTVFTEAARHFSGRGFSRNNTLWQSYVVATPSMKIYIGGDSGYDTHYADIGAKHGPIDLVILDNGQYDQAWKYIHTLPHEVLMAARDMKAKRLFPVHSSKFEMANHPWDEPLIKVTELNKDYDLPLVTPIIGEVVNLNDVNQKFTRWWEGLR